MILLYILTTRKAWPQCRPQVRRWIDTDYFGGIRRTTDAFPSFFDSAFTLCYEQYLLERLPLLRRKPARVGAILDSRFGCDVVLDKDRIAVPAVRAAAAVLQRPRLALLFGRF